VIGRVIDRRRWLIVFGAATVAFDVAVFALDRRMQASGGPGILGLEFAGSKGQASRVLGEWGSEGREAAHASLLIDYGFMLSYGVFFALAGFATRDLARRRGWLRLAAAGAVIPLFAPAAASFDAIENVLLLMVLGGDGGTIGPPIAAACAGLKFALIAIAIGYVVCGLVVRLRAAVADHV
jgi:hypothetical protein